MCAAVCGLTLRLRLGVGLARRTSVIKVPIHVLLAEDNPGDAVLVRMALEATGIAGEITLACNGDEAIRMVERAEAGGTPAFGLFLLDLNLPHHDGAEILARVRRSPTLNQIPVIMLTSSDSPIDRERCLKLGATRYFLKPTGLAEYMHLGQLVANSVSKKTNSASQR